MEESRIEPVLGLEKYSGTRSRSTAAAPDLVRWRSSAQNCLERMDKTLTDFNKVLFSNCALVWSRAFQRGMVNYMHLNHSDTNTNIYIRLICLQMLKIMLFPDHECRFI